MKSASTGLLASVCVMCCLAACRAPESAPSSPPPGPEPRSITASASAEGPSAEEPSAEGPFAEGSSSTQPSAVRPYLKRYVAGNSVENRPIEYFSIGNADEEGDETVLIMASIHGDEPAGTPLLWRLAEHLRENPHLARDRRIVLVPEVNPDGLHHGTRCNVRGVDLNRNFNTANRRNNKRYGYEALSEPEAAVVERIILDCRPARIVSIHQPLACIDYDGPAIALASCMSRSCGLPVRKLGALPGSLGSFTGTEMAIPTITFELPRNVERLGREELWELYGDALLTAIFYPEDPPAVIEPDPVDLPAIPPAK